jgi:hypothetical protein
VVSTAHTGELWRRRGGHGRAGNGAAIEIQAYQALTGVSVFIRACAGPGKDPTRRRRRHIALGKSKTAFRPTQLDLALMDDPKAKAAEKALRAAAGEDQGTPASTPWPKLPIAPKPGGDKAGRE